MITGKFSRDEAEQVSRIIATIIGLSVSDPGAGPVWGEAEDGLQLGVSGIRQDRRFEPGDIIRFQLSVRNVGAEAIRFEYKPPKTRNWIAPYVENARGEQVKILSTDFRGGHDNFTETLEPKAVVAIHLSGILVLGASDTAEKDWPRIETPEPGDYRLRAGFLLHPLDANGKEIVERDANGTRTIKTSRLTSGPVTFQIGVQEARVEGVKDRFGKIPGWAELDGTWERVSMTVSGMETGLAPEFEYNRWRIDTSDRALTEEWRKKTGDPETTSANSHSTTQPRPTNSRSTKSPLRFWQSTKSVATRSSSPCLPGTIVNGRVHSSRRAARMPDHCA